MSCVVAVVADRLTVSFRYCFRSGRVFVRQGTRLAALLPQDILETFRDKSTSGPRGKEVTKAVFDAGMQASGLVCSWGSDPHLQLSSLKGRDIETECILPRSCF